MKPRITREQMLLEIAYAASRRGTCDRLHVGAVVSKDFHPVATGYVGAPAGEPHCDPSICDMTKPCTRTDHAEVNAIKFAREALGFRWLWGYDLTSTDSPCLNCAEQIVAAGIRRVWFHRPYRLTTGISYMRELGVEVMQIERAAPDEGIL